MISQWRLPAELGGGVVNPTEASSPELATMRRVKVPGTTWTVYVPAVCLVPMLPEEPPVNSLVIAVKAPGRWGVYQRMSTPHVGRWSSTGGSGLVHTWQELHTDWDAVHVVLWWDKGVVEEGVSLPSGPHTIHPLVISDPDEDTGEPGVAKVRLADGRQKDAHLDRDSAFRAAAALLGLALKERM